MSEILDAAIRSVRTSQTAFCRFITANDVGKTGSHQAGFYIPKCAYGIAFKEACKRGENYDKFVSIKWQNDFTTNSRFIYYGVGSRNEYRLTRFGRGFPFLEDDNVGDLLLLTKQNEEEYNGFVLQTDDDIDDFLSVFNLSPNQLDQLIDASQLAQPELKLQNAFSEFLKLFGGFPTTQEMAAGARNCFNKAYNISEAQICRQPDELLLQWVNAEYDLFKAFEDKVYAPLLKTPFPDVQTFVQSANEILNRRKSRAGKSLEHHLATIFTAAELKFEEQAVTEENKKPDILFPDGASYHNLLFPAERLVVLGAKTTCKDRWRQVLTEADRVDDKYLFTLQKGISANQLREMQDCHLHLVVPRANISSFPAPYRDSLSNLHDFIGMVREKQTDCFF